MFLNSSSPSMIFKSYSRYLFFMFFVSSASHVILMFSLKKFDLKLDLLNLSKYSSRVCLPKCVVVFEKINKFSLLFFVKTETFPILGLGDKIFVLLHP